MERNKGETIWSFWLGGHLNGTIKKKPCREAYEKMVSLVDIREVDDYRKIPIYLIESKTWWTDIGRNHRKLGKNRIARDMPPAPRWFVKLDTLEELIAFLKKYGQCVVSTSSWLTFVEGEYGEIEIYDGYRE